MVAATGAVLAVARQRLRRRRGATALLLVVTGVGAAAPMALWAAARQTSTALDRFVDDANVPDSQLFVCPPGYDPVTGDEGPDPCFEELAPRDLEVVRSLPAVSAAARFRFYPVSVERERTDTGTLPAGLGVVGIEPGGLTATLAGDPIVVDGRLPSATASDEVVATEPGVRSLGVGVGDRVAFRSQMPSDGAPSLVESEVVGVIRTPIDLLPLPLESTAGPAFHTGAAWLDAHGDDLASYGATAVWLQDRDVDGFLQDARARFTDRVLVADPVISPGETDTIEHATSLESRAGLALAATAALAGAFLVGQAVSRQSRSEAADDAGLSALGMTRRQLAAAPAVRWLPVAVGGTLLGVVLTWAAAALGPIGVARRGLWERSPSADWPVLAIGAVTTFVLILAIPVLGGLRRGAGGGLRAPTAVQAAAVGSPGIRAGIGFAWASVRRGATLSLVSAVLATALALVAIVTAAGGAASLRLVTDEPVRFGARWDALVAGGGDFESGEEAGRALSALPGVASAAGIVGTDVAIGDEESVWVQALVPVGGVPLTPPVLLSGRAPRTEREIALGSVTMEDAGAAVGEEVALQIPTREAPLRFEVVGTTMVTDGFEHNVGHGGLVTPEGLARLDPAAGDDPELAVEVVDGPGRDEALRELRREVPGTITPFPVPATLANAERIAGLPVLLAAGGAVLAAITFVHALVTSVRRNRREIAVCRVLGFTRRQVHGAVATQATFLALAAVVVGVPLGVIAARWGWRTLARSFGIASGPVVPAWVLLAGAVVVVVVANLAAAPPARSSTRRGPAAALRTE